MAGHKKVLDTHIVYTVLVHERESLVMNIDHIC